MKDIYETIEMEIIKFHTEDIITASGEPGEGEEDEF